jgi:hypothetical protein
MVVDMELAGDKPSITRTVCDVPRQVERYVMYKIEKMRHVPTARFVEQYPPESDTF